MARGEATDRGLPGRAPRWTARVPAGRRNDPGGEMAAPGQLRHRPDGVEGSEPVEPGGRLRADDGATGRQGRVPRRPVEDRLRDRAGGPGGTRAVPGPRPTHRCCRRRALHGAVDGADPPRQARAGHPQPRARRVRRHQGAAPRPAGARRGDQLQEPTGGRDDLRRLGEEQRGVRESRGRAARRGTGSHAREPRHLGAGRRRGPARCAVPPSGGADRGAAHDHRDGDEGRADPPHHDGARRDRPGVRGQRARRALPPQRDGRGATPRGRPGSRDRRTAERAALGRPARWYRHSRPQTGRTDEVRTCRVDAGVQRDPFAAGPLVAVGPSVLSPGQADPSCDRTKRQEECVDRCVPSS